MNNSLSHYQVILFEIIFSVLELYNEAIKTYSDKYHDIVDNLSNDSLDTTHPTINIFLEESISLLNSISNTIYKRLYNSLRSENKLHQSEELGQTGGLSITLFFILIALILSNLNVNAMKRTFLTNGLVKGLGIMSLYKSAEEYDSLINNFNNLLENDNVLNTNTMIKINNSEIGKTVLHNLISEDGNFKPLMKFRLMGVIFTKMNGLIDDIKKQQTVDNNTVDQVNLYKKVVVVTLLTATLTTGNSNFSTLKSIIDFDPRQIKNDLKELSKNINVPFLDRSLVITGGSKRSRKKRRKHSKRKKKIQRKTKKFRKRNKKQ